MLLNSYSNGNVDNSVLEQKAGAPTFSLGFTLKFSIELIIHAFLFHPEIIRNIPLEFTLVITDYLLHISSQFSPLRYSQSPVFEHLAKLRNMNIK